MKKESTKEEKMEKAASVSSGAVSVILLSGIFFLLGMALLFNKEFSMLWFCYLVAAAFSVVGIITVCGYFIRKEYLDVTKYGFSSGIFLIILGFCVMVRAGDIARASMELFGILLLLHSMILLQYTVQMYMMEGGAAGVVGFFTLAEVIAAVIFTTNPGGILIRYPQVFDGVLIACGLFGWIAMLLVKIRRHNLGKEEKRNRSRMLEDEPVSEETQSEETPLLQEEEAQKALPDGEES